VRGELGSPGATVSGVDRRPSLLVLNQYYKPGVEATANLLAELCEGLAEEYQITVVTGRLTPYPDLPTDEMINGVRVIRTRSTAYDRSHLHRRASNYLTYMADSLYRSLRLPRPDLVLTLTDPPMIGDIGLVVARRFKVPLLVVSEDVFPEIAVELKRLEHPILVRFLRELVSLYLRRADHVVAIGETMRLRLQEKGASPNRISVIENWVDTSRIVPRSKDTAWARDHDIADRFVVMHSGNIGHVNDLVTLIRAATFLRDLPNLRIVVIGFGALQNLVRDVAKRLDVEVVFLDYQPREVLSESLSSADLHYVGLARGLSGFVVPSRAYGIMAAGRPMLVSADEDSETVRIVRDHDCGIVVPPGRPELVARAIRDAYEGRFELDDMGRRGRAYVEREADKPVALARYRDLIGALVPSLDV
jgi:colanic acid biosynthesis glycosyl transferase WcaI